ncbi:MAG: ATP-binding protein, partial [Lachnospiraceae bacterium]|nr:ATP-binding protein [Lachnospiraceae bacterium]
TIPKAESLDIEFKSDLKCYPDHDLIEEIVGMTNTSGGFLFLGVEDDGSITGVHKKHKDPIVSSRKIKFLSPAQKQRIIISIP